jgi:hypothetical protein
VTGNGRNLVLLKTVPVVNETVLVPVIQLPWRDDEQDRIQPEQEKAS